MSAKPIKAFNIGGRLVFRGEDLSVGKNIILIDCNLALSKPWGQLESLMKMERMTEDDIRFKLGELQADQNFYSAILKSSIFED